MYISRSRYNTPAV